MRTLLALFTSLLTTAVSAQTGVFGTVTDEAGKPLDLASVALLHPADSTVAYFALTDTSGYFRVKQVAPGSYLLNVNQYGYRSILKPVEVGSQLNAGIIALKANGTTLDEVDVIGERSPMTIKGDTLEYNSAAFRTSPDAAVEDLLKKLPGVEVDAAGNIRAQGSQVEKIMVDGKEFFSNDPKVVSKNLPADAVKKVQVFDEKSDEEQFTGISDGDQNKTINLVLKDDRKKLWFGNAMAGAGTNARFQSSLKAFNFQPERQLAFLGMANNINQFGFTLEDYMDYSGGISSFMDGNGRIELNGDNLPIDFGQPVFGSITSGVGAMNYTANRSKGRSFNLTYMGSGQDKRLDETSETENYLPNGETIFSDGTGDERTRNGMHRIGFSFRDRSDSLQQLNLRGGFNLGTGRRTGTTASADTMNGAALTDYASDLGNRYLETKGDVSFNYNRKTPSASLLNVFKLNASANGTMRSSNTDWFNSSRFYTTGTSEEEQQLQGIEEQQLSGSFSVSAIRKIGAQWYMEPGVDVGFSRSATDRVQQRWNAGYQRVDSVSGEFVRDYRSVTPALNFKRSGKKLVAQVNLGYEAGLLTKDHRTAGQRTKDRFGYLTPGLFLTYSFKQAHRLGLDLQSYVTTPGADQLNPIPSTVNRMQVVSGNPALKPEYSHRARLNWNLYDNFTFISIFADVQAVYTQDKINLARTVNADFSQALTYVNVDRDVMLSGMLDFSSPVRKLGLNVHLRAREQWNRGIGLVNGVENVNLNRVHSGELSIDNRKKTKWDGTIGMRLSYTTSDFSLQPELNADYLQLGYFSTLEYMPENKKWNFLVSAELTDYGSSNGAVNTFVPLLSASVTRFLGKNKRFSVELEVFDILNRNTGIQQQTVLNYFRQTRSNILSQYAMATVTYKIGKK